MFDLWRYNRQPKQIETVIEEKEINFENTKKYLGENSDVMYKKINIQTDKNTHELSVVFIDGLINIDLFDMTVLKPLKQDIKIKSSENEEELLNNILNNCTYHISASVTKELSSMLYEILNGSIALISDTEQKAILFEIKGYERRSLSEPSNESALKGPKTGFIEALRINTALIRRSIRSTDLKIESLSIGKSSTLPAAIVYMGSLADKAILEELKKRISEVMSDNILNVCDLEEQLFKDKFSILPKFIVTERPDKFCSNITDGKIGVLVDGLPTAIIVPSVLNMFFQSPDDYSTNYFLSSCIRVLRYICTFIALTLPAVYISILCYHQELLSLPVAKALSVGRSEVPLTTFQEVIFLMLAFEILFESGLRMPKTVGQTVPIIGGLVVGDAAVSAKLLSPVVVVLAAVTGIAGFMIPNQDFLNLVRICRFFFVFCAIFAGFAGLGFGILALCYYLCSAEVFGVPYLIPFVANEGKAFFTDTFFRPKINLKTEKKQK